MKHPLVSVIINCYNGEKYLREAIDSIYIQTYQNWEIIFWDNASTDGTAEIAHSYDEKLRYFLSEETTVLGEARVKASKKVRGFYIAFLDADDVWLENKLERQVAIFQENSNQLGFVYGRSEVIFENNSSKGFVYKEERVLPDGDILSELAKENSIVFSSAMVDRNKFFKCGGFPEHLLNSTDYWVFLHMAKEHPCGVLQEVCCKNRIHDNSLSASQKVIGAQEAIDVIESMLPDKRIEGGLEKQYANLSVMYIKELDFVGAIRTMVTYKCFLSVVNRMFSAIYLLRK